ncbi:MAG: JAB domain-containing protein [Candidatus Liberibacter ctenarytainae]|uniref:JAB domain-containing protein n=1 Tax=Candidatus Liberibacter ctenarytainae TaxID=2020335 RepID=A0A937AF90_9HYPH|nr:JAB domain-containing protein [Candidatus Liberibacter ctenarytainae]
MNETSVPPSNLHEINCSGHRKRLRNRFITGGESALADYEILELILFRIIPRRDTKSVAKALLKRFKTLGGVFGAPKHLLREVPGIGTTAALELQLISVVSQRILKGKIINTKVLDSWSTLLDYCKITLAYEEREQFRILFLNKNSILIADEIQSKGTVDHTPVYLREIVRRCLELSATAIILVHNHPSGNPTPSTADIEMTRDIVSTLDPLKIIVHDHIIVGKNSLVSFKGLRII